MITQLKLTLQPLSNQEPFRPEWAYRLYSECLKEIPFEYGEKLHNNSTTPVSQYLKLDREKIIWTVNLLGEEAEKYLTPVLLEKKMYHIGPEIKVTGQKRQTIKDVETLLVMGAAGGNGSRKENGRENRGGNRSGGGTLHQLYFETPAAFKSQRQYTNLPTIRLLLQNLINKWNGCFPEMQIEDEDGQGMDALIEGLYCTGYGLHD